MSTFEGAHCNWAEKPCVEYSNCMQKHPLDITILLDSSFSAKYDHFEKMKIFTERILNSFDYSSDKVRASVVLFGNSKTSVAIDLEENSDIISAIKQIEYDGIGNSTRNTDVAIDFIKKTLSTDNRVVEKIFIIVTNSDGVERIEVAGVSVYAIGFNLGKMQTFCFIPVVNIPIYMALFFRFACYKLP